VQLKDWLKERNIQFKEIDLSQSQEAIDDFVKKLDKWQCQLLK